MTANIKEDFQYTRQIQVEDVQCLSLDTSTLRAAAQQATDAEHSLTLRRPSYASEVWPLKIWAESAGRGRGWDELNRNPE